MSDDIVLEVSDELRDELPIPEPETTAKRVTIPERGVVRGDGARAGWILDCPSCGTWGVLGTEHRIEVSPPGMTVEGPVVCRSCGFVCRIVDGEIEAIENREKEETDG